MKLFFDGPEVVIQGESPKVEELGRAMSAVFRAIGTASTLGRNEYRFTLSPVHTRTRVRRHFEGTTL